MSNLVDPLAHIDTGTVPRRIDVAINTEEVAALERMILIEGVSLTEAVRRLIGLGDYLHRKVIDEGSTFHEHRQDGSTSQLVLLQYRDEPVTGEPDGR